jgi:oligopeptide/dipeptide ABC transporter ATP-binding protein
MTAPLLELRELRKHFPAGRRFAPQRVHAVDGVTLSIREGETLGLVGESGCGKSTLARCAVRLAEPNSGEIRFGGQDITHARNSRLRPLRRQMQMVFQDPAASLNPRKPVGRAVGDALAVQGIGTRAEREDTVRHLLSRVGLGPEYATRLPAQLSGGQRQRIGIARALALRPRLIVADEPVSALDVSVRAGILNLLRDVQAEFGITYLFISHDLGVIRQVSDRVGVMYLGKLVELAPAESFFAQPRHPYSRALLAAIPVTDPARRGEAREGLPESDPPSPMAPPPGCRFHPRCPRASARCAAEEPALRPLAAEHFGACHHPLEAIPPG